MNKALISIMLFLLFVPSHGGSEEVLAYKYVFPDGQFEIYFNILGISKEEGLADAMQCIRDNNIHFIGTASYLFVIPYYTHSLEETQLLHFQEIYRHYNLPCKWTSPGPPGVDLLELKQKNEPRLLDAFKTLSIYSDEYVSWYNTLILNYLLSNPQAVEQLKRETPLKDPPATPQNRLSPKPGLSFFEHAVREGIAALTGKRNGEIDLFPMPDYLQQHLDEPQK